MKIFRIISGLIIIGLASVLIQSNISKATLSFFEELTHFSDFSYIRSIAIGYEFVYFGTTEGVAVYNTVNNEWVEPMTGIEGLVDRDIFEIRASSNDEYIWVRTESGIFEYNRTFERWTNIDQFPSDALPGRHLSPEPIYFAPFGYNYLSTGVLADYDNRRFPLTDIIDDGWGNLWIGTWGLGAARSSSSNLQIELLPYGLYQSDIVTMELIDNILWICGDIGNAYRPGMTLFKPEDNDFQYVPFPPGRFLGHEYINALSYGEKNVFAATDDGVLVIDRNSRQISDRFYSRSGLPDNRVLAILAKGDSLFVGTEYGLGLIRPYMRNDSSQTDPVIYLPALAVYSLLDAGDALWIGTSQGVFRLQYSTDKLGFIKVPELRGSPVYKIARDAGHIWLATDINIVSIDLNSADVSEYPELASYGEVTALAVRDTILAAGVTGGLLIYIDGKKPRHVEYTINDGLLSSSITSLVFDGEILWIGSDRGLTRFRYLDALVYR